MPEGLLCAKFQCYNKPRNQCSECSIYYCIEHVTSHIHTETFQDLERTRTRYRQYQIDSFLLLITLLVTICIKYLIYKYILSFQCDALIKK